MYIVIEIFPDAHSAAIVTDETHGFNKVFDTYEEATEEANECQRGLIIEIPGELDAPEVEPELSANEHEIIMFHLSEDNECYYCFSWADMIDFAELQGKEVESWGIAVNGMPDGALSTNEHPTIYINFGEDQ